MATERKLFGTDGVRGEAGDVPHRRAGDWRSAGPRPPRCEAERPQVLIVRDTRESGPMLEAALAAGVAAAGGDALLGGVLPTPGRGDPRQAARPRPRGGRLRLPQPLPRQRDQVLRAPTATKLDDEVEARIEALLDAAPAAARRRAACAS